MAISNRVEATLRLNDEEVRDAWQRIFRTPEGCIAYASLEHVRAEIGPHEVCALQEHNGRRSFAAQLMTLADVSGGKFEKHDAEKRVGKDVGSSNRISRRHGPAGRTGG